MHRLLEQARRNFVNYVAVATAIVITGLPGRALGADDSKRHSAFQEGVAAIQSEKWDDALAIYRKLWDEEHTYDVALSLGQVELNMKAYRDAAEHLDFGIKNVPPREEATVTARARQMLDLARKEVAAIDVRVDRTNADVLVDGKAVGKSPLHSEVFLEPGAHTFVAKSEGSTPVEQAVHARAGQKSALNLVFGERNGSPTATAAPTSAEPAPGEPSPSSPPSEAPHDAGESGSGLRTAVLISGIAITAIAAAVTVTFALKGSSASSDADDARARATTRFGRDPCSSAGGASSPECTDLASALDRRASDNGIANVSLFVGVVAGVSTAAAFVLWPKSGAKPERAVRLTPAIGRHEGGAVLTGSF